MKVLVTGGAGYIGSHAVRRLIEEGHDVTVLDNLSHGYRSSIHREARFIQGDIGDEDLLRRIFVNEVIGTEAVMHFAAFIEVAESVKDPYHYYLNNFSRALSMLNAMRACGVNRLVFSSTAAVYGNPLAIPIVEAHPLNPINPYGRAKMMTEMAIQDFSRAYGLGYAILRYFNVAGAAPDGSIGEAHYPESHLIPRILAAAQSQDSTVEVFGTDYSTPDGTCIRDYIHVMDLIDAHLLALKNIQPGQGTAYNLGSEKGFSVLEVLEACRRVTGRSIAVLEQGRRPGDPTSLVASSAKIRNELGWTRQYPHLDTMVAHAWQWHQNTLHQPRKKAPAHPAHH